MTKLTKVPPGKKRRSIGDGIHAVATLNAIKDRERKLAIKSKAKAVKRFHVKATDAIRSIQLAEDHDEDLSVVDRACWLHGLRHFEEWASRGKPGSAFTGGDFVPRLPSQDDPAGEYPAVAQRPFERPRQPPNPPFYQGVAAEQRPATRTVAVEEIDTVHAAPVNVGRRRIPMAGLLPSGYTDNSRNSDDEDLREEIPAQEIDRPGFFQDNEFIPHEINSQDAEVDTIAQDIPDEAVNFGDAIVTEVVSDEIAPEAPPAEPVKRRRGRPRKYPVP